MDTLRTLELYPGVQICSRVASGKIAPGLQSWSGRGPLMVQPFVLVGISKMLSVPSYVARRAASCVLLAVTFWPKRSSNSPAAARTRHKIPRVAI